MGFGVCVGKGNRCALCFSLLPVNTEFYLHAIFFSCVVAHAVRCKELGGGGKKGDEEGNEEGRRKSRERRQKPR